MTALFASLPIELVLAIFSLAAVHQPTALAFVLVSSWTHRHVDPALYHTVRLRSSRSLAAFITTLNRKPPGFIHANVKRLCITALGPIPSIHTVLSACTGVESLACGFSVPSYVHCLRPPATSRSNSDAEEPRRDTFACLQIVPTEQHLLALACRDGLDVAIVSPAVSRLRLQLTRAVTPDSLAQLAELPHLTHLAVVYNHDDACAVDALSKLLRRVVQSGRLRVLVLQVVGGAVDVHMEEMRRWGRVLQEAREAEDAVDGQRAKLVVCACKASLSFLSEWEHSDAFWQLAEGVGVVA